LTYVKICSLDAISPESLNQFTVNEREILVINSNGKLFCLDARCTHAGAPLAEGTVNNDVLTCPWHGSKFRITDGTVLKGPAEKELHVYPYIVKDNLLFIEL
jgi:nitrite reductase/ring-hydroxylating ferredoxin subunit